MKYCTYCGKPINDDAKFCTFCGKACGNSIPKATMPPQTSPNERQTPPPMQEKKEPPVSAPPSRPADEPAPAKPPRKAKKKGKIILISILAILLAAAIGGGYLFFTWYTSTEQQILRALENGEYDDAYQLLEDDLDAANGSALSKALQDRMEQIRAGFIDGTIEYEAARMELDAIAKLDVVDTSEILADVRKEISELNTSRTHFSTAESFFSTGDYKEALQHYRQVIESNPNFEAAKAKLVEAADLYREDVLAKAASYVENNLHSNAVDLLKEALGILPDDTKLTEQLRQYEKVLLDVEKAALLLLAENYANAEDYFNAWKTLDSAAKVQEPDAEILSAYNGYVEKYIGQVIDSVDDLLKNNDFDGALSVLNTAIKNRNESVFITKLAEVEAMKPVSITSIRLINSGEWGNWNEGSPTDPFGNDYSSAPNYVILGSMERNWNYDKTRYAEYRIYGDYTKLTATIAPSSLCSEKDYSYLQIYGDDELLYTSPDIGRKTDAFTFTVDLTGVDYIKILVHTVYGHVILSNVLLWP